MDAVVALFILLIVIVLNYIITPFCLVVVLGIFSVKVGFWACFALVVIVRALITKLK